MNRVVCPGGGALLLTGFPGSAFDPRALRPAAIRGLAGIAAAGASTLLTLVEKETLARHGVADLGDLAGAAGLAWLHLPMADFATPDESFVSAWRREAAALHRRLDRGETIAVHCRAGLGRTGTVAAMILIERGLGPEAAIVAVRRARPGAIETAEQEAWARAWTAAPRGKDQD